MAFLKDFLSGYRESWLVVPEGNGKSTLIAGLGLYHLAHTEDALVPVAAASKDQAKIIYKQARGFVRRGGALSFRAYDGYKRVICAATGGEMEIFGADDRTGDGIIPTLCFLDELHRHKDMELYETWRGKLWKRNAQLVTISTAGEPGTPFEETREKIRQSAPEIERQETFVRAASDELVLHEWAVPESGDVEDFELVKRANPLKAITVETLKAKYATPTMTLGHWRRFTCNLPTRDDRAAIQEAEWYGAIGEPIPQGERIWLGLDVAWKWDTTAAVPLWWKSPTERILGPASIVEPPRDGSSTDPYLIKNALLEIHETNPIECVIMDMSQAEDLAAWIREELKAEVPETNSINKTPGHCAMYASFMEALREGWLKHQGDAGLTRHALNAIARVMTYGDARFDRPMASRSSSEQDRRVIDALTAAAMVHWIAATNVPIEPLAAFA